MTKTHLMSFKPASWQWRGVRAFAKEAGLSQGAILRYGMQHVVDTYLEHKKRGTEDEFLEEIRRRDEMIMTPAIESAGKSTDEMLAETRKYMEGLARVEAYNAYTRSDKAAASR